jgi:hypothetical protein
MSTWDELYQGTLSSISFVEELSESLSDGVFVQRLSEDATSSLRANHDRKCPDFPVPKDFQNCGSRKPLHKLASHGIL